MEIQAKLSFRHGRIMKALDYAGITLKELSTRSGCNYQDLIQFVSFKRVPKKLNRDLLVSCLKSIDPTIKEFEIFPEEYDKIKGALQTQVSTRDIPIENLLSANMDNFALEDKTADVIQQQIDTDKLYKCMYSILDSKELDILKRYIGIDYDKQTLKEIGQFYHRGPESIRIYVQNAIRKLRYSGSFRKFHDILDADVSDGAFTEGNLKEQISGAR